MTRGRKGRSPSTSNKGRPGGRCSGFCPVGRSLTPGKGGDFAPVAAHGHGAPPASARAGSIVEKQAASRIGAQAEPRTRALGNHFGRGTGHGRSEEHTSELQSLTNLVCRLLLEKKKQRP